ncbi:hypothetical protein [uncultured Tessaracoccus sp.]|uniref:hypothetical protein n=1 Tax=uncultured Tessaracoccus sp. TaxID=905023 RepID=UPI0025CC1CE2|nr:hypothetical protein [uncultured Tessaracoccus sp.]
MGTVNFFGLEVDVPDDPVAFIKTKVIELLNYMGYEWPVTDDGTLDAWGDRWAAIESQINGYVASLDGGVAHVSANNEGAVANAFLAHMRGDDSNVASLRSIADAAPVAAQSYHGAALLVRGLRAFVIGKIILDAAMLAAAIISGGASAGASFLIRTGISAAINIAIDQAINALLGGA